MAKSNNAPKNDSTEQTKPFGVYVVDERNEDRSYWTKVGVAFPSKSGRGFSVIITPGIAVSGRLVILEPKADEAQG